MSDKENTVTIALNYYNKLRDFKESIEQKKFVVFNGYEGNISYYSTEEFESVIITSLKYDRDIDIKRLKNELKELKKELKEEKGKRRKWYN